MSGDRAAELAEAWAEAGAGVEAGWMGPAVEHRWPDRWRAWVYKPWPSRDSIGVFAESEEAALRSLRVALSAPEPTCLCGTDAARAAGKTLYARLDIICPKHDRTSRP